MIVEIGSVKNFIQKYKNVFVALFFIILFAYITLLNPDMQNFNKDELHAWNIAENLNIIEIIRLMRAEGHTFLWYLILKPFTYNQDIFFPWIIKFINWLFVFTGLVIFWFKAPQKLLFKILITFSLPFTYLAVLGRCYGIGIFLFVCIAVLYKNKLSHPILFSILLFLTANTSFIAVFGVLGLSLCFLYDLIKTNNKQNIIPIIIILLIPISLFIQWHNPVIPDYVDYSRSLFDAMFFHLFKEYNIIATPIVPAIIVISGIFICLNYFYANKRILFYVVSSFLLFYLFTIYIYASFNYHYQFMFILLCIYNWIYLDTTSEYIDKKSWKYFNIWFVCLCLLFSPIIRHSGKWFFPKDDYKIRLQCIQDIAPEGSIIYSSMYSMGYEIPYLKDKYILKTFGGDDLLSFNSFYNTYKKDYINNYKRKYLKSLPNDGINKFLFVDINYSMDKMPSTKIFGMPENCINMYIYQLK